ncbi:MAG: putative lipoprotein [Nitrosomonas sp.]|nr:putative lipoprotein [Nitrosomonas sp.]
MRISISAGIILILVAPSFLTGCSISYSTGKSSDSISASSDSISDSSGSSGGDSATDTAANNYTEDVMVATARYASSQKDDEWFLQAISAIARSHGIVDWERDQLTYTAMGKGLKQAGIDEKAISTLAYFHTLPNRADYLLVLAGYHQS